ncbi:polymer-forming cytoskeletal protein, partial [Planctomycetota bacterium]
TGLIIVGNSGAVKSEIKADKIIVYGEIEGNILARVVEIMPKGSIVGNVTSEEIVIEREGKFEGESRHKDFKVNPINETPKKKVKKKSNAVKEIEIDKEKKA